MRQLACVILALLLMPMMALAQESSSPLAPEKVAASNTLIFGDGVPTLTCAPSHYCALALQQGETIKSVDEADRKWSATPTTYGAGQFATPVVILSPSAVDLSSTLTVTTDRRVYNIKLLSSATKWAGLTAFSYPNP
jgi:type IV secretion system protein VirB9